MKSCDRAVILLKPKFIFLLNIIDVYWRRKLFSAIYYDQMGKSHLLFVEGTLVMLTSGLDNKNTSLLHHSITMVNCRCSLKEN